MGGDFRGTEGDGSPKFEVGTAYAYVPSIAYFAEKLKFMSYENVHILAITYRIVIAYLKYDDMAYCFPLQIYSIVLCTFF